VATSPTMIRSRPGIIDTGSQKVPGSGTRSVPLPSHHRRQESGRPAPHGGIRQLAGPQGPSSGRPAADTKVSTLAVRNRAEPGPAAPSPPGTRAGKPPWQLYEGGGIGRVCASHESAGHGRLGRPGSLDDQHQRQLRLPTLHTIDAGMWRGGNRVGGLQRVGSRARDDCRPALGDRSPEGDRPRNRQRPR
jgi:hypothetical protein